MGSADLPLSREEAFGPEQSVIGSMLIDPKVVGLVVSKLSEGDFAMEINRRIFLAFRRLYLDNRILDSVTVLDLVAPGDPSIRRYMLEVMDLTPTAAHIEEYIVRTRKQTQKLQFRAIGKQLQELEDPEDALPLLRKGEKVLAEQGRDDEADMAKSLLDFYADLERVPQYLKWGFPFLDAELYAERQDFVILAGRPSDGKTALALHMAYTQAAEHNVGFFSLETGRKRLFSRLISSVSGVAGQSIKKRNLSEMEYSLIAGITDSITKHSLHVVEASRWAVEHLDDLLLVGGLLCFTRAARELLGRPAALIVAGACMVAYAVVIARARRVGGR
ncbi:MAG: DnaB-like helicase C-terminal domain-containing protein [Lawsonibacter sp.]|nr:DnaB-like helicase C-terminal domain-containing protein [Lawsonibacter sp.]